MSDNLPKPSQNWRLSAKWLQIKPISLKNCIEKTGEIISGEPLKKEPEKVLLFGKYKGRTKEYVKINDPQYFEWAAENIKIFS